MYIEENQPEEKPSEVKPKKPPQKLTERVQVYLEDQDLGSVPVPNGLHNVDAFSPLIARLLKRGPVKLELVKTKA